MSNNDDIRTIRYSKWTKWLTLCYVLFCFISIILFVIHDYQYSEFNNRQLFDLATATLSLWMINPMVLIISFWGFVVYLKERRDARKRERMGKKWVVFTFCSIVSMISWMISAICFVHITGGV